MRSDLNKIINKLKNRFHNLDFSKSRFVDLENKSIVICKTHGEFETSIKLLNDSRTKYGCSKCASNLKYDSETVISILSIKHPKLDFSKFEYRGQTEKSTVICPIHGDFRSNFASLKHSKHGCPKCAKPIKKIKIIKEKEDNSQKYVKIISEKHPNLILDKFVYNGFRNKSIFICPEHGEFEDSLVNILNRKNACSKCLGYRTKTEVIKELKNRYHNLNFNNFKYDRLDEMKDINCMKHGIFKSSVGRLLDKRSVLGCPKCSKEKTSYDIMHKSTKEDIMNEISSIHTDLEYINFDYNKGKMSIVKYRCKRHNIELRKTVKLLLKTKNCCPECLSEYRISRSTNSQKFVIDNLTNRFPNLNFSKFIYDGNRSKSIVMCPEHGEFKACYFNLMNYTYACPKCHTAGKSKAEEEIYEFIKSFYDKEIKRNDRSLIKNIHTNNSLELDFYLPDISLAIEFNGIYYHSDKMIKENKIGFNSAEEYHTYKTNKCKEKNISLLHISEEEWLSNKSKVLDLIKDNIINKYIL